MQRIKGDSSVHRRLLGTSPYGIAMPVEKIECISHLLRNFCNNMRKIKDNTQYPAHLHHKLDENVLKIRTAISCASIHWKNKDGIKIRGYHGI